MDYRTLALVADSLVRNRVDDSTIDTVVGEVIDQQTAEAIQIASERIRYRSDEVKLRLSRLRRFETMGDNEFIPAKAVDTRYHRKGNEINGNVTLPR